MNKLAATAAMLAALPLSAPAASLDYFLKIDDIKGEAQDKTYKEWIDVMSFSWGMSNSGSGSVGGGSGAGKATFLPFSWEQGLDSSFVPLFLGVAKGTVFDKAEFAVVRAGETPQTFFTMTMSSARLTSLSSSGSDESIGVDAAMTYDKIEMSYRPQGKDGKFGSPITGAWDIKGNKAAFSGDPMVMMGLVEAGGNISLVSDVPEPATWGTLAAGLVAVGAIARRRRKASAEVARAGG